MPVNRNALIRYRTIDNCLRNLYRKWTLNDLINACSEALYEYEGINKGVSRRTVQADIQIMRSDKLGYNAPIVVSENKYYKYDDPNYSITNMPLSEQDIDKLSEIMDLLKQFKGFSHFHDLNGMIQKLEDRVNSAKTKMNPIIDIEKNENLKGLEHLETIYNAILTKQVLNVDYQPYKAEKPKNFNFHAYLLKEYRNRWFVFGKDDSDTIIINLALDRICSLKINVTQKYLESDEFDKVDFFKDIIGVTVRNRKPKTIKLFVNHYNAPYVLTKPFHHSQELISESDNGVIITIKVIPNFELEREILGFGDGIEVLSPEYFRKKIMEIHDKAVKNYIDKPFCSY